MQKLLILCLVILCFCETFVSSQLNCYGGSITQTVFFGGAYQDFAFCAQATQKGDIFAGGYFQSNYNDLPPSTQWTNMPPFSTSYIEDCWISKSNTSETIPSNMLIFGAPGDDLVLHFHVDEESNNVCVVGTSQSAGFPQLNSTRNSTGCGGCSDYYLMVFDATQPLSNRTAKYSVLLGGGSSDFAMKVHCKGDLAYIAGHTFSVDLLDATNQTSENGARAFLTIVNFTSGIILSENVYGNEDTGTYVMAMSAVYYEVGNTKRIALCGVTTQASGSTSFPVSSNAFQTTRNASNDGYVMFLNVTTPSNVTVEYLTYYGGNGNDACYDITADEDGYVYIAGQTSSNDLVMRNAIMPYYLGGYDDAYLAAFHPNGKFKNSNTHNKGTLVFSTYFGGSGDDKGAAIDILKLSNGNFLLYFGGFTESTDMPVVANFQYDQAGRDTYIAMLNITQRSLCSLKNTKLSGESLPSLLFSTYIGGSGIDLLNSLQVLPTGRMVLSGSSTGTLPGTSRVGNQTDAFYMLVDCPYFIPLPSPSVTPSTTPSSSVTPSTSPSAAAVSKDNKKSQNNQIIYISAGAAGGFVILASLVIVAICVTFRRNRKDGKDVELNNAHYQESVLTMDNPSEDHKENQEDKKWEIAYPELTIKAEIGRGAFGVVYKGRWRNCDCVVKQLNISRADEKAMKDFLKEAETTKKLRNHQNVCTIFGVCTSPEYPICIVMEFVAGGNLQKLIFEKTITLNKQIIIQMGADITSGMSHLHHENVLHCDLGNTQCMELTKQITDFGLAHTVNTDSDIYDASSRTVVPIRWSAPEVLTQLKMFKASDVWSFGVVMWEILEAKNPYFKIQKNEDVIDYVCEQRKVLPKPQEVDYPGEIYTMMVKCWSYNPADRPTFDELYEFFDALSEGGLATSARKATANNNKLEVYGERSVSTYGNKTL